tara:strand:- start:137 stop:1333 length:1197 start_codon:yes stop_codon:yes gene_type:complete
VATFANTLNPTPFGFFDNDVAFQTEANAMVVFTKRKLGDDILSVELTKKQIWACFEESLLEYSSIVNTYQAQSQIMDLMGFPTGSALSGSTNIGPHGYEQMLPRSNLDFVARQAESYVQEAGLGGSYNSMSGSIALKKDVQDYDIYELLKDADGNTIFSNAANTPKSKLKIFEVFHFSPQAAYRFFDTTSAINYLNNEFSFESFTPETIFYILPVFEDVLRAGQLDLSSRVRRSNYSYKIVGTKIRIFPRPTQDSPKKLWIRVGFVSNPFNPAYQDDTKFGTNNLSNIPYGNLWFDRINSIGRQWIRQYTLACSKEVLGLVRSKFGSVPIADSELSLNGDALVTQGREEKADLKTVLREILDKMTYNQLIVAEADKSDAMTRILKAIPMPMGKSILMG